MTPEQGGQEVGYFIVIVLALGFFMGGVALTDWLHERDRKRAMTEEE